MLVYRLKMVYLREQADDPPKLFYLPFATTPSSFCLVNNHHHLHVVELNGFLQCRQITINYILSGCSESHNGAKLGLCSAHFIRGRRQRYHKWKVLETHEYDNEDRGEGASVHYV